MKNILVTGGAGYIGSHMVEDLILNDYFPVVFDNLSNTSSVNIDYLLKKYEGKLKFIKGNILTDLDLVTDKIDAVIHFAALKSVNDSISQPLEYYWNNTAGLITTLTWMQNNGVSKIIFSSTAAVYGDTKVVPVEESAEIKPITPYGKSKYFSEEIIRDTALAPDSNLKGVALRYFNIAGNSLDGSIGDTTPSPQTLVPALITSALGYNTFKFRLFGNKFSTPDGTAIRDYIHMLDLVHAHRLALQFLDTTEQNFEVINLGTQKGTSVQEIINAYEETIGRKLDYTIEPPRGVDIEKSIASSQKAKELLGWSPQYDIKDMISSAWEWYKTHPELFKSDK